MRFFRMPVVVLGSALVALATGCATSSRSKEPLNLTDAKAAVIRYHDSGDYARDLEKVAAEARAYIEKRGREKKPGEKMAVIFDIDETVLSSYEQMRDQDFGYVPEVWDKWVDEARAEPIEPVKSVYYISRRYAIWVFYVTGRKERDRLDTVRNLARKELADYMKLYCAPDESGGKTTREFKTAARKEIAAAGYTIIANIGDQQSDLDGGYAEKTFKLPNPFYRVP